MARIHAAIGCLAVCLAAGCASRPPSRGAVVSDNLRLYDLYDNSRDWGPSFLVGPPDHHFGDQARIDDTRTLSPIAAVSSQPPVLKASPEPKLPPLPPLP